jgi:phosphoglycolate phosphatase
MIQHIFWDLDGTLVDSVVDLQTAVNAVRASQNKPLPPASPQDIRNWIGGGARQLVRNAGCQADAGDLQMFHAAYAETGYEGTVLYPGIEDVLYDCRDRGQSMVVVTNKTREPTMQILSRLGIADLFAAVHGGDVLRKPDPAALASVALGNAPDQCLMVGDHHTDLAAAVAFECSAAWVRWGYGNRGQEPARYVCQAVTDLAQVLAEAPVRTSA